MRQPEMSHSPVYYQNNGQTLNTLPSTHPPSESLSPGHSQHQKGVVRVIPSDLDSIHDADAQAANTKNPSFDPHRQKAENYSQAPAGFVYPVPEQPAVAPVTFVFSPRLEDGSILTRTSNSSGVVRKEERVRGSWTDHSSYMSSEHYHHSAPRVYKRVIPGDDPPVADNQDALSMLFRLSLPVPIFSLCTSIYTIFGLIFVILMSPLRLCSFIPYLRSTSFRGQLCDLLVPQLHLHERLVCLRGSNPSQSTSSQSMYNDPERLSPAEAMESYSVGGLLMVLLLSSLLSIVFLLLAWTAAFFWVFAMILGNPDGTERRDDGRAAVLGVSRWWQLWLGKARKSPN